MMLIEIFAILLSLFLSCASTVSLPDLYWNSSNPLFHDLSHGAPELHVQKLDSLVIHCPTFNDSTPSERVEQLAIYRVSKYGYNNCVLDEAKVVGRCSQPYGAQKIRTVFREFTPLPNGLEYEPGKSYYFISTSDGSSDGLDSVAGGLCLTRNMKLIIHVHNHRHSHSKKRNYHTSTSGSIVENAETTKLPAYWNEFWQKFSGHPAESHKKSHRLHETVALDSNSNDNRNDVVYERSDGSFSQALRLDPTSILYEIHEFDENAASSTTISMSRFRTSMSFILFILVRWLMIAN